MDASHPVLELLRKGRWFGGLPPELQQLIVQCAVTRSFRRGSCIVREGAPARAMYAVLEGNVRVTRLVGDGKEILVYLGQAGFWFGDYAVLARAPSIGSTVADTPVRALVLKAADFERIVRDEPRYYRHFADLLLQRYADLFRYLGEAPGLEPEEWLRTRLVDLAAAMRRDNPSADSGRITVSQAELATMVGVSRQTLSALLGRLEERGLVKVGFRSIRVLQ